MILCYPLVAAYVAYSFALALPNARGTSHFYKIPLSVAQIPFVFPYVPKGQKAKHLVSFWCAKGNVLAMKSEPLMQRDEMESST